MSSSKVRVYFLSSGRIGIPILDALCRDTELELVGIGSQPDKEAGRKKKLAPTPLAFHAQELGLAVDKPLTVNSSDYHEHLKDLGVELLVVASFGQILKPALLDLPRLGCLNVHASLLPKCRGAAPISEVILNGDEETGVTFMKMDQNVAFVRQKTSSSWKTSSANSRRKASETSSAESPTARCNLLRNRLKAPHTQKRSKRQTARPTGICLPPCSQEKSAPTTHGRRSSPSYPLAATISESASKKRRPSIYRITPSPERFSKRPPSRSSSPAGKERSTSSDSSPKEKKKWLHRNSFAGRKSSKATNCRLQREIF